MNIQKLNWAGLKILSSEKTILIDAVEDFSMYEPALGKPLKPTLEFSQNTKADYILFTHLHLDHFDFDLINKSLKPDGKLIVYSKLEESIQENFQNTEIIYLELDETFEESGIKFKPVFAMDGIGDLQSSWIIEDQTTKIFHGGDTIWHNQFWKLGNENQNIKYAFLPANGVVVNFPMIGLQYSSTPASMSMKQSLNAAHLLHSEYLVPIHYGLFNHQEFYKPLKFTIKELIEEANKIGQKFILLEDGESLKDSE